MTDGYLLYRRGLSQLPSPICLTPLIFTMQGSQFGCLILLFAALSCLIQFAFITLSLSYTHTSMLVQATAPCSRKPNSSSEYHGEEGHQPDVGPGL